MVSQPRKNTNSNLHEQVFEGQNFSYVRRWSLGLIMVFHGQI